MITSAFMHGFCAFYAWMLSKHNVIWLMSNKQVNKSFICLYLLKQTVGLASCPLTTILVKIVKRPCHRIYFAKTNARPYLDKVGKSPV